MSQSILQNENRDLRILITSLQNMGRMVNMKMLSQLLRKANGTGRQQREERRGEVVAMDTDMLQDQAPGSSSKTVNHHPPMEPL